MEIKVDKEYLYEIAAQKLLDETAGDDDLFDYARSLIRDKVDRLFRERVESVIAEEIAAVMQNAFDREYQPLDSWGDPKGEKTTIRERLQKLSSSFWTEKVDKDGKASNYGKPRSEYAMRLILGQGFDEIVKQDLINFTGSVKDKVREEMRNQIDATLNGLFKVRSQVDKKEQGR